MTPLLYQCGGNEVPYEEELNRNISGNLKDLLDKNHNKSDGTTSSTNLYKRRFYCSTSSLLKKGNK